MYMNYGPLSVGALGVAALIDMELLWRDQSNQGHPLSASGSGPEIFPYTGDARTEPYSSHAIEVTPAQQAAAAKFSSTYDPTTHCAYRFVVTIEQAYPVDQKGEIAAARDEGERIGQRTGRRDGRREGLRERRDAGREAGRRDGIAEGRAAGRAQGREEGRAEGRRSALAKELPKELAAFAEDHVDRITGSSASSPPHNDSASLKYPVLQV